SWSMSRTIAQKLHDNTAPAGSVATLRYYHDAGLLNAKTLEEPDSMQVYAHVPDESDPRRFFFGNSEGNFNVAFDIDPEALVQTEGADPTQTGLYVKAYVGYVRKGKKDEKLATPATQATTGPATRPYYGPFIMSPE